MIVAYESDESVQLTSNDKNIIARWRFAQDSMTAKFKIGPGLEDAIMQQFNVSRHTAKKDIAAAKTYFLTEDRIDRPFWRYILSVWQLKGISLAYHANNTRDFNAGIKNLFLILGLDRSDNTVDPKLFQQNIYNFFSDPGKIGIEPVTESEIVELIDSFQDITPSERKKLFKDAAIDDPFAKTNP